VLTKLRSPGALPALLFAALLVANVHGAAGAQPDDPALAAVMQKYADAIGGEKLLSSITSVQSVYSSTLFGHAVTVTTIAKAPASFVQRVQVEGTPLVMMIGFDGKTAWTKAISGAVQTLSGSKRADVIDEAAGMNNSEIIPQRWPTQVKLKADETVDGKLYHVVEISPQGGSAHDLLLDSQTYLPVMSRQYEGDVKLLDVVKNFAKGPLGETTGAVIVSTRSDGSVPAVTSTLLSTRDNIQVNDAIFAPPIPTNAPTTNT